MNELLGHVLAGSHRLLLPAIAVVTLVGGVASFTLRLVSPVQFREGAILLVGLTFCGYLTRVIGGNSASPIAPTVVTGIVGLIGGLVAYVHTRETSKALGLRSLASIGLIALLLALTLGLIVGASYKRSFDDFARANDRYNVYFKEYLIPRCLEERKLAGTGALAPPLPACSQIDTALASGTGSKGK